MTSTPSAIPVYYGYQGMSKTIDIPNRRVGVIIGKDGETVRNKQARSGACIQAILLHSPLSRHPFHSLVTSFKGLN